MGPLCIQGNELTLPWCSVTQDHDDVSYAMPQQLCLSLPSIPILKGTDVAPFRTIFTSNIDDYKSFFPQWIVDSPIFKVFIKLIETNSSSSSVT